MNLDTKKHGAVLIDKEQGLTSADVVHKVRRLIGEKSVGHTGTLDPMATGLLILMVGGATRLASYVEAASKEYAGIIKLGIATDSEDITGEVTQRADIPDLYGENFQAKLDDIAKRFLGPQSQVPPTVSAIKVNGERAYKLHRSGAIPKMEPRKIEIYTLSLAVNSADTISLTATVSKGTYIRSLARDIATALATVGTLLELRRTKIGTIPVSSGVKLSDNQPITILPIDMLFPDAPIICCDDSVLSRLATGDERVFSSPPFSVVTDKANTQPCFYGRNRNDLCGAVGKSQEGRWRFIARF